MLDNSDVTPLDVIPLLSLSFSVSHSRTHTFSLHFDIVITVNVICRILRSMERGLDERFHQRGENTTRPPYIVHVPQNRVTNCNYVSVHYRRVARGLASIGIRGGRAPYESIAVTTLFTPGVEARAKLERRLGFGRSSSHFKI